MLRSWEYPFSEDVKRTQQMTSNSQLQQTQKQEQDCWHLTVSIHDLFLESLSTDFHDPSQFREEKNIWRNREFQRIRQHLQR